MCTLPITGGGIMDYKANTPIYLQVIDDIKRRILTGEIKLGDKLPSTRELAVQYTVNPNTGTVWSVLYQKRSWHICIRGCASD